MKIGIIGGGFYGCYLAKHLSKNNKVFLFEKNKKLIQESGKINQYRLHQGFHYPRSESTIKQTKEGFNNFFNEFKKFIYFPRYNFYCIHKNSHVDFASYLKIIKKNGLEYKIFNKTDIPFLKNEFIEGAVNTHEGVILIDKLNKSVQKEIKNKCYIKLNTNVIRANSFNGQVETKNRLYSFDKIINTTYTNPNLGLSKKKFNIKYELAGIVIPELKIKNVPGITIMDGDHVSLYPRNKNSFSLTSVKYTPIKKFKSLNKINYHLNNINNEEKKILKNRIYNHVNKYINLGDIKNSKDKFEIAPKTKINDDQGDVRTSEIIVENKLISVLCGKLDTAPLIYKKILKII